jgi:predicted MFS family arabinose efflux permease
VTRAAPRAWLPPSATPDARRLVVARALRGFADGFLSILLPAHLTGLGFEPVEVGALLTATLLGSAALTLAAGLWGGRVAPRAILLAACGLMLATAAGLELFVSFWPLLLVAFVGTMNPSAGDVSVFLPTEQFLLSAHSAPEDRTALFARYNLGAAVAGALGALATGIPALAQAGSGGGASLAFAIYGAIALMLVVLYVPLRGEGAADVAPRPDNRSLGTSRSVVLRLAALFSLDSFGGGFVVQSLLALWLFERFDLSLQAAGSIFFAAGLLTAASQLLSARLARRIGLIRTMVFTHLPANVFLILAAFMPTLELAVLFLLLRMALSQMDVPARQAYVMAIVRPEHRAAAASVTNVPRSLAAALAPWLGGALLGVSSFGWPLVAGGALKIVYDLLLFARFRAHEPRDERQGSAGAVAPRARRD